jgi:4-hydroxy-3-methylbut-2-en-1-yl diphosphate synthase IspG/GcpE
MHHISICCDHGAGEDSVCMLQLNRKSCHSQVKKCADAGADIVRITVQGKKEAEACMKIREQLFKDG